MSDNNSYLQKFQIGGIPCVLWGKPSDRIIVAVHGQMSNKEDAPIKILAQIADGLGYQTLSFDLPEHGERINGGILCKPQNAVPELIRVMEYAKKGWSEISVFANSIGAYLSMLAYKDENLQRALFLSPVVDMRRIIENMMKGFSVTQDMLKTEREIPTPSGQILYYDYYRYVRENPIEKWQVPTYILYGDKDSLCEKDVVSGFARRFSCKLKIADSEHWFHTENQLRQLEGWIGEVLLQ